MGQSERAHLFEFHALAIHEHKARSVPDFIHEVARAFRLFVHITHIAAGSDALHERKAQAVRAVLVDNFQRVDTVAERFTHLSAQLVAHYAVNEHFGERYFPHMFYAREYHSRHPEEDYVVSRYEQGVRIEVIQIRRLVGESERRKRPERAGKPGIKHVLVLIEHGMSAFGALAGLAFGNNHVSAFFAVIGGNAVTPPQLSGNAPVLDVFHPIEVNFGKTVGNELRLLLFYRLDCGLCKRLHLYEPLLGNYRFDRAVTAVALPHVMGVIFYLHQISALAQVLHYHFARLFTRKSAILLSRQLVERAVVVHNADDGQVVP